MSNYNFKNSTIFGGLLELNKENILLRSSQINDGFMIHTCNDYNQSLEVIKEASYDHIDKVRIISKVYYKYPNMRHRRFRSIYSQLKEQNERLGFLPYEWCIQICCYCALKSLLSSKAQSFLNKIKNEFGITKIYFETYPIYNYDLEDIILLNKFYIGKFVFGLIGYQNLQNRVFKDDFISKLATKPVEIIFMRFLGNGSENKFLNIKNIKRNDPRFVDLNILYFLSNYNKIKNMKGLTSVSSFNQYEDLKERILLLQNQSNNKESHFETNSLDIENIYFFKDYDQYGGLLPKKKYLFNPKFLISKLKYFIKFVFKSNCFFKDFFG